MGLRWQISKFAITGISAVKIFNQSHYDVEGGHRAVEFNQLWGTKDKVYGEGTHLIFPFLEWPTIYDVRAHPFTFGYTSETRDLQMTVNRDIRDMMMDRAVAFHLAVDDVSITKLTFSKEFTAAIEAKQVAAQEAERAKYVVERAKHDKKSAIIRAQGEAKSALLIGKALGNDKSFVTLRKIEASKEIARTVSESKNCVLLNTDELLQNLQGL